MKEVSTALPGFSLFFVLE